MAESKRADQVFEDSPQHEERKYSVGASGRRRSTVATVNMHSEFLCLILMAVTNNLCRELGRQVRIVYFLLLIQY